MTNETGLSRLLIKTFMQDDPKINDHCQINETAGLASSFGKGVHARGRGLD